ncbi:voltage-dependent calcium channel type D subunit alpha-1-like [Teleopsis dalmanni]|uniref:voltage-dependent calcium channel type D subunit alpha-1-like n=1 Tax=Teleopsis dalmanni TaxID=139649 RepID=UPI0018CC9FF8|nr:voltage-dependent calcium channel type D subunit alpha-1-like [Teleopsis dalmanni]
MSILIKFFYISGCEHQSAYVGNNLRTRSTPVSPDKQRLPLSSDKIVGLAESLIGEVLVAEGLGKYCDSEFVGYATREMQEALDMTPEEMNLAAHNILLQENDMQVTDQ